jgi:hypothetical protein
MDTKSLSALQTALYYKYWLLIGAINVSCTAEIKNG